MRRSTSRIGKLPKDLLESVNEKLHANMDYRMLRRWLFEQVAEEDVPALGLKKGEKFSEVWFRSATSPSNAGHFCDLALSNWYRGWHQEWARKKLIGSEVMRIVRKSGMLTKEISLQEAGGSRPGNHDASTPNTAADAELSVDGGDILMRSVLVDAVSATRGGQNDPQAIAQLAQAWARLKHTSQVDAKLKLKTEDKLTMALNSLKSEITAIPEALELFHKMYDMVMADRAKRGLS